MTLRSRAVIFTMSLLIAMSAFAATGKRRAVVPGQTPGQPGGGGGAVQPGITLTGVVVDSVTGAPVVAVQVTSGSKSGHTDKNGNFFIQVTPGTNTPLHFLRNGYQQFDTSVNISADATQTFRLIPKATVKVRLTNGTVYELDPENVEFGYVAPFSGYNKDTKLNLCKAGGEVFTPERDDIKRITAAPQMTDAACCPSTAIPAVNVELKSGSTATAGFVDACFGYKVDIIGQEHVSTNPAFLHFSDIAEIIFP